jgi:hypothetical protein
VSHVKYVFAFLYVYRHVYVYVGVYPPPTRMSVFLDVCNHASDLQRLPCRPTSVE